MDEQERKELLAALAEFRQQLAVLKSEQDKYRWQLDRIVSDIESEKRTRTEANSDLRTRIERLGDKFEKTATLLTEKFEKSWKDLAAKNEVELHRIHTHLGNQDKFQYKFTGALVATQLLIGFLAPLVYKFLFKI
jgi:chromosome segregation ATPase